MGTTQYHVAGSCSVNLALSREWTAFEAHKGGDRDANRVIALAAYGNQKLGIGSAMIDFDNVTGVKTFLIKIRFGARPADRDTAELFINGVSQGAAVDIGTGFAFDRIGFAASYSPENTPHFGRHSSMKGKTCPVLAAPMVF